MLVKFFARKYLDKYNTFSHKGWKILCCAIPSPTEASKQGSKSKQLAKNCHPQRVSFPGIKSSQTIEILKAVSLSITKRQNVKLLNRRVRILQDLWYQLSLSYTVQVFLDK